MTSSTSAFLLDGIPPPAHRHGTSLLHHQEASSRTKAPNLSAAIAPFVYDATNPYRRRPHQPRGDSALDCIHDHSGRVPLRAPFPTAPSRLRQRLGVRRVDPLPHLPYLADCRALLRSNCIDGDLNFDSLVDLQDYAQRQRPAQVQGTPHPPDSFRHALAAAARLHRKLHLCTI